MITYYKANCWKIFGVLFIITILSAVGYSFVGDGNIDHGLFYYTILGRIIFTIMTILYVHMITTFLINLTVMIGKVKLLNKKLLKLLILVPSYVVILGICSITFYIFLFVISGMGY